MGIFLKRCIVSAIPSSLMVVVTTLLAIDRNGQNVHYRQNTPSNLLQTASDHLKYFMASLLEMILGHVN
jgi:hypothetical protein